MKKKYRSTETIEEVFKERVEAIFGIIENYTENQTNNTLSFDINTTNKHTDVSFEELAKLSDLIGTRKINLNTEYQVSSGCETCGYGAKNLQPVTCSQVNFHEAVSK